jgi:Flp pilus assembly protein TadD
VRQPQPPPARPTAWGRREWLLAALLAGITLLTFSPVSDCSFVNYDDPEYVSENVHVLAGLTRESLSWGLTSTYFGNWHPLVWWSLMLDAQLYGPGPAGFHRTNLLWHTGSVLLLFAALRRMTGQTWPSFLAAALFAVHPLNVEPVAWVAERKGVLSTFFWMLTLWLYARYAERPGLARYLAVVLGLALGLMAKPMLVTLPCVLLLLDFWPLRRLRVAGSAQGAAGEGRPAPASLGRLVAEKLPLLAVVAVFIPVALATQKEFGALPSLERLSLAARLQNVAVSYVVYLGRALHPADLAPFYPHRGASLPVGPAVAAAVLLLAMTAGVLRIARRVPYLAVGWLWYLGTLVPVIGLVQIGSHAQADRYTYVPLVGLFVAVSWSVAGLARRWHCERAAAFVAGLVLVSLMMTSWAQVHAWHDDIRLWQHTLAATGGSGLAHHNLADALLRQGDIEKAVFHFRKAVRQVPRSADAHHSLGRVLLLQGKVDEAESEFRLALGLNPSLAVAHNSLGAVLRSRGESAAAMAEFREALRLDPSLARVQNNLGLAFGEQGQWEQAVTCFRQAVALRPWEAEFHRELAFALRRQGRVEDSAVEYQESLRLDPRWPKSLTVSTWVLATRPDPVGQNSKDALRQAQQVCQATGDQDPRVLDALAAAHAQNRQFSEAVAVARKAQARAAAAGQTALSREIEERLRLYEKGQPYRSPTP